MAKTLIIFKKLALVFSIRYSYNLCTNNVRELGLIVVFSGFEFIFRFFPVFLITYYIASPKFRNCVLFLGSLLFYAWGEPVYVGLLFASALVNYIMGRWIPGKNGAGRKGVLTAGVVYNIGILAAFKYMPFLTLPIGISFYTFQAVSYLVDVYRGVLVPEKRFDRFATYLCMFPQLTAGPLVGYEQMQGQLLSRNYSLRMVEKGLRTFVWGLAAKVLLANRLGLLWHDIQTIGFKSISTPMAWLGAFTFSMEIYFDFLGYSLMAVGVGRMLGFYLPENFHRPYMAKSVTEFYRRWHMTLGAWFRRYIYIPLGGNRTGIFRTCRNLMLVWLLTGIWHGAGWNFLLWGGCLGILIILEKLVWLNWLNKSHVICRLYILFVIPLSWMLFAITDVRELGIYFGRMFGIGAAAVRINHADFIKEIKDYWPILLTGAFFCTSLPGKLASLIKNRFAEAVVLLFVFWLCIYYLYVEGSNPFMYFRF